MRHKYVRYDFFLFPVCFRIVVLFAVVVEIVTQGVCLCVTIPRSTTSKTAPFYFMRIKHSQFFFCLFIFWKSLICGVLCVDMQGVFFLKISLHDFYHKDLPRVYQKQNLALSWFKPASTLSSKYECWCEFEKDLKVVSIQFFGDHTDIFNSPKCGYCQGFRSKYAVKFKLKCTGHGGLCGPQ